ncbi:hypothetical protein [Pseudomonas sp. zfem003]|uniref:hypothetical protein n=1 Tax=Pseudomonas sp. zfem003 TaxID=3078198 RepID=UPI0029290E87|nr:hypothetical protein [Pseudomonas sp. zfem003]MDU9399379.1 hypothetical protein [Pseudomonas sp. zfem003]
MDSMDSGWRPSIAYVDEHEDERSNFFNDAFDTEFFNTIYLVAPTKDLDELLDGLLSLDIDALVSDFNLSEAGPLSYDGDKLVSAFMSVRCDFPCFIRTAYGDQAISSAEDVNRVYSKGGGRDKEDGRDLFARIVHQINRYKSRLHAWQEELDDLNNRPGRLSAAEVERAIELDGKIESSISRKSSIPSHIKKHLLEFDGSLIEEAENLIKHMRSALKEGESK